MSVRRDDVRRLRADRRARACTQPTRFVLPAVATAALALALALLLGLTGAPVALLVGVICAVVIGGAVIAHRTTASLVAGATLLIVRPYRPGEPIRLYAPEHGRAVEAEVVRVGPANTTLAFDGGLLVVANTRLLRGPQPECTSP